MKMNRKEYEKYRKDYIDSVNLDNIEFRKFSYQELLEFLKENYYDSEFDKPVYWEPDGFVAPFGMYYLEFTTYSEDMSYLLGLVDNNKGGKTIVYCMVYDNDYGPKDEESNVGYIFTMETNYFFRNKGILNKSLEHVKKVFSDKDILVISPESVKGSQINITDRICSVFDDDIIIMDEEEYVDSLMKRKKW